MEYITPRDKNLDDYSYDELMELAFRLDIDVDDDMGEEELRQKIYDHNEKIEGKKEVLDSEDEEFRPAGVSAPKFNETDRFVLPEPFERRTEALEMVDPMIPGDFKYSKDGKLYKTYFAYASKTGSLIDVYDNWVANIIEQQIRSRQLTTSKGIITFKNKFFITPRMVTSKDKYTEMSPNTSNIAGLTYSAELYVDMIMNEGSNNETKLDNKVFIGRIPVMIGSVLDNLRTKSEKERQEMGMCTGDSGGYFIVNGNEKVVLVQENLRVGRIFTFTDTKGELICRMTVNTPTGSSIITLGYNRKSQSIVISLPFMGQQETKSKKIGNNISIFQVFRLLNVADVNEIRKYILKYVRSEWKNRVSNKLLGSVLVYSNIQDDVQKLKEILEEKEKKIEKQEQKKRGKKGKKQSKQKDRVKKSDLEWKEEIITHIKRELFPQIENQETNSVEKKLDILGFMIARFVEYLAGFRQLDDRDHWGNKRLESAGRSMEKLFNGLWRNLIDKTQKDINLTGISTLDEVRRTISASYIESGFFDSFNIADNWGVPGQMVTENIVENLKRENALAMIVHTTKISVPTNRLAKQPKLRMVHASQFGFVCPAHTPEGEQCFSWESLVLLDDGSQITFKELLNNPEQKVMTVQAQTLEQEPSNFIKPFSFLSSDRGKTMYEITTITGRKIEVTNDHPFLVLCQDGNDWVKAEDLTTDNYLWLAPQVNPASTKVEEDTIILDEHHFDFPMKDSLRTTHKQILKKLGLLPLRSTDKRLPIIARMAGFVQADGSLGIYKQTPSMAGWFGLEQDAEEFEKDVERLGFTKTKITFEQKEITDKVTGRVTLHSCYRTGHGSALPTLLIALGMTTGKKTANTRKPIPDWIMNGSDFVKREFVAGFQGGDGTSIFYSKRKDKRNAYSFNIGATSQQIKPEYQDSLIKFMSQMRTLIEHLGVKVTRVDAKKDKTGGPNMIVAYAISRSEENIIAYMDTIGYRYTETKRNSGIVVAEYLKYKHLKIQERIDFKNTIMTKYKNGESPSKIARDLGVKLRSVTSVIEYDDLSTNGNTLAPKGTFNIEQFLEQNPVIGGKIALKIKSKVVVAPTMVGDFTTISKNHSFVANSFITHNCGLVKNMAVTTWITLENDGSVIMENVQKDLFVEPSLNANSVFWLNNRPYGWCDGKTLYAKLIGLRRQNKLPKGTAIVLDSDNVLNVFCDGGRPTRPLLIIDKDGELMINKLDAWNDGIDDLLRKGCLEYIDAYEQDYIRLAVNVADAEYKHNLYKSLLEKKHECNEKIVLMEQQGDKIGMAKVKTQLDEIQNAIFTEFEEQPYTHCEMHPSAYLGIAASLIPMANYIQGPRNVYACAHQSQSLGAYHSNHRSRYDTTFKTISHPSPPIVQTELYDIFGMRQQPTGQNIRLAFMIYSGLNQEDSIIFNKGAIDRGLFRMTVYKSYKAKIEDNKNEKVKEEFGRPEPLPHEDVRRYAAIDENGFPIIGSYVKEHDYIIGKIRRTATGIQNASVKLGIGQEGIITDAIKIGNLIRVKIREERVPQIGDKFASRFAQKATLGAILPQEDMPYSITTGLVPDAIANPHAIPSRMTLAMLFEMLTGKTANLTGEFINATSHRPFDIDYFKNMLLQYGYTDDGNETYINGKTGKLMQCRVFTGPCYYMALRHHVQDKIQFRGRSTVESATRQPTGGRTKGGGIRVGEMERDSIIQHAASATLRERLCLVSDAHSVPHCLACGNIAIPNTKDETFSCNYCESSNEFGICEYPFVTSLFFNYLAAAGISVKFKFNRNNI